MNCLKKQLITCMCCVAPLLTWAGEDDFGVWTEIGVQKELSKKWDVGAETDFRSQQKDRWSIGADVGFRPCKYLKLGAAYNFLYTYHPEEITKQQYDDGELTGYRWTDNYWSSRHRLSFDVTGTAKLWKWLRISLRERYQFTYRCPQTLSRTDVELTENYTPQGFVTQETRTSNPKERKGKDDHILRSRLKLSYDRKHARLCPFLYAEFHNELDNAMELQKIRTAVGMEYKISKRNEISLSYLLNFDIHDDEDSTHEPLHERLHVLSIGYNYNF